MKAAMYAIIKKDFRIIASNRRLFPALFIVPLVLTIVLPSILLSVLLFSKKEAIKRSKHYGTAIIF